MVVRGSTDLGKLLRCQAMAASREPLTSEQVAAIDAEYRPFPTFSSWPAVAPHPDAWRRRVEELKTVSDGASADELVRAQETAIRAAAFDTGAIEGLYQTNRGLTRTIAEQTAAWEQQMQEQAPAAAPFFEAQLSSALLVLL
jgi:Fic family protein